MVSTQEVLSAIVMTMAMIMFIVISGLCSLTEPLEFGTWQAVVGIAMRGQTQSHIKLTYEFRPSARIML